VSVGVLCDESPALANKQQLLPAAEKKYNYEAVSTHRSSGRALGRTISACVPSFAASRLRHRDSERDAWRNEEHVVAARATSVAPRNPSTSRSTCEGRVGNRHGSSSKDEDGAASSARVMRPEKCLQRARYCLETTPRIKNTRSVGGRDRRRVEEAEEEEEEERSNTSGARRVGGVVRQAQMGAFGGSRGGAPAMAETAGLCTAGVAALVMRVRWCVLLFSWAGPTAPSADLLT